jgi:hypothetical protein
MQERRLEAVRCSALLAVLPSGNQLCIRYSCFRIGCQYEGELFEQLVIRHAPYLLRVHHYVSLSP